MRSAFWLVWREWPKKDINPGRLLESVELSRLWCNSPCGSGYPRGHNDGARLRTKLKLASTQSLTPAGSGVLQRKCACGGTPGPTGECEACRDKKLQRKSKPAELEAPDEVPPIVHDVLRSPGQPLEAATRAFMEPRFGHDFSNVRVHNDARAMESAHAVKAAAYTVGRHIVFAGHQLQFNSLGEKQLLAHELTHVVQQRQQDQDFSRREIQIGSPGDIYEREADAIGNKIIAGKSAGPGRDVLAKPTLQRGILDVLAAPFVAIARVFGAEIYSDDELLSYYRDFVEKGQIENAYDSDNKARALVKRWKVNQRTLSPKQEKPVTIVLDARKKAVLAKEMYQGHRSGGDVEGVLDLLRLSDDNDVSSIVAGVGEALLSTEKETAEFVAQWKARKSKPPPTPSALPQAAATADKAAPRTAEKVSYELHATFMQQGLSEDNVKAGIEIFGKTDVANELVEWLQNKSIQTTLRFVAQSSDIPGTEGSIAAGWFQKIGMNAYRIWVAAGQAGKSRERSDTGSIRFVDRVMDKRAEDIAHTIFHELLHVWFTNRFPKSGTGHSQEVAPPVIGIQGGRYYDEAQYDQRFLAKLKQFDAELRLPQAKER
jgi:Domain of unknown function (DUF4157)